MARRSYLQAVFRRPDHSFVKQAVAQRTVCSLLWNAVSTATLTFAESHPIIPTLSAEGGIRSSIWMITEDGGQPLLARKLMEGRVGQLSGEKAPHGTVVVPVVDDWQDFATLLGWQVPGSPIGSQSGLEYARYTGKSEANAKSAIAANAARLGRPWDVTPTLGLGTVQPLELRMDPLSEKLIDALRNDRLQLTIERPEDTDRWTVDVVEGEAFTRPISPQSGVLQEWSWVKQPATATRAIVGGRGDGTARQFVQVIDTALEAEMGVALEIFVDARNADEGADLAPYGWAKLAEHRGKAGFTAALRETSWFRFPDAYGLGTKVQVKVGALDIEDVITKIEVTHDARSGFSVVPTVGLATKDPNERLVGFVNNVATAVRGLGRR